MEQIRDVQFAPLIDGVIYRLQLFDTGKRGEYGKARVAYRFGVAGKPPLFETDELMVPYSPESDETVRAAMCYITMRPGDTDREYFDEYTDAQIAFASSYACECLQLYGTEDADDSEPLEDFEPLSSSVERLAGEDAYYPYLIIADDGVECIDFDGLNGDDRIRPTYNPKDWTPGDWTYAEDTHILYMTGNGQALYRNLRPDLYNAYCGGYCVSCGAFVESLIGRPDGRELCASCEAEAN